MGRRADYSERVDGSSHYLPKVDTMMKNIGMPNPGKDMNVIS